MKILIGMHHPKQFWMFKYLIEEGKKRGWEFRILISEKDVLENLLKSSGLDYIIIGKNQTTIVKKLIEFIKLVLKTLKYSREFDPDIFIGQAFPHLAIISALLKKPYIIFEDTEVVNWLHRITLPYSDFVITPNCFRKDFRKKHVRFNGYFELAYLHPKHFTPNPSILNDLGLSENDRFIIVRFSEMRAMHDIGHSDIDIKSKYQIINKLRKYGQIFISSESPLPKKLEKMNLKASPEKIHDILHYATMFFGESGTMATEAGILGTPSIRCTTHVGPNDCGNFIELEKKYGLMYSFKYPNMALKKAIELLGDDKLKNKWLKKSRKLIEEKIDVTEFMEKFIGDYPNSAIKK